MQISRLLVSAALLSLALASPAKAVADGPDAWQVIGISSGDSLNVRMGPGTNYPAIGKLAPGARGLENITCVPLRLWDGPPPLSQAEIDALPPRWCLVFHRASGVKGWVAGRFLAEDSGEGNVAQVSADPQMSEAIDLVTRLMDAVKRQESGGPSPLQLPEARQFFVAAMIPNIDPGVLGADPIVGGQDADLGPVTVEPDPDQPPLRGSYPVRASFTNFGQPRLVTFYVSVDTDIAPQMRIIGFEADGTSYQ